MNLLRKVHSLENLRFSLCFLFYSPKRINMILKIQNYVPMWLKISFQCGLIDRFSKLSHLYNPRYPRTKNYFFLQTVTCCKRVSVIRDVLG